MVHWGSLSDIIINSISKDHYILGCNSQAISELTSQSGKNVVSFENEVDALFAADFVSLLIASIMSLGQTIRESFGFQALSRLSSVFIDPDQAQTLGLSDTELSYWVVMAAVILNLIVLNLALDPSWGFVKTAAVNMITLGKIGVIWSLIYFAKGWATLSGIAGNILSFVADFVGYAYSAFQSEPWYVQALFAGSTIIALASAVMQVASLGSASVAKILAASASIASLAAGILADYNDSNWWVG